jgi:hypothetical protein
MKNVRRHAVGVMCALGLLCVDPIQAALTMYPWLVEPANFPAAGRSSLMLSVSSGWDRIDRADARQTVWLISGVACLGGSPAQIGWAVDLPGDEHGPLLFPFGLVLALRVRLELKGDSSLVLAPCAGFSAFPIFDAYRTAWLINVPLSHRVQPRLWTHASVGLGYYRSWEPEGCTGKVWYNHFLPTLGFAAEYRIAGRLCAVAESLLERDDVSRADRYPYHSISPPEAQTHYTFSPGVRWSIPIRSGHDLQMGVHLPIQFRETGQNVGIYVYFGP